MCPFPGGKKNQTISEVGRKGPSNKIFLLYNCCTKIRSRQHTHKRLTGDYLTYARQAADRKTNDPHCRLCQAPYEDIKHILAECRSLSDIRQRILPDMLNLVSMINPSSGLLNPQTLTTATLTQFILDCGSINLNNSYRLSYTHPGTQEVFRISRDWCFSIHNMRTKLLKQLKNNR